MQLRTLIDAVEPRRVVGATADVEVAAVTYSTAQVIPGALHVCIPGFTADGHDFAGEAVARGAVALVVERELDIPAAQLVVASARQTMALAADAFNGHPSRELAIVGVTGTNGKTT